MLKPPANLPANRVVSYRFRPFFGVRLAAAFPKASLLAAGYSFSAASSPAQSGSKLPHTKTPEYVKEVLDAIRKDISRQLPFSVAPL